MADGTFNTGEIGDTIKQALLMRYQQQQGQVVAARQAALERMKAQAGLAGRLTLSGPNGQAAPFSAYLGAAGLPGGQDPSGFSAQPTPAFGAVQRAGAADNASAQRDKAATAAQNAKLTENLKNYDTSAWKQQDYAAYYGTGQLPKGAKPIPKPAAKGTGSGGATKDVAALRARLTALDKEEKGLATITHPFASRARQAAIQVERQDIDQKLKQMGATAEGGAAPAPAGGAGADPLGIL